MPTVQRKPPSQNIKKTDKFYLCSPWRNLRELVLHEEKGICYYCQLKGRVTVANIGDHFRPRRIFPELSLVRENIKPSCQPCHDKKRNFEARIATREQFEREIHIFIKSMSS